MTTHVKVGLVVVTALAVFMVTVFMLGQQQHLWERKVRYDIHFARAGGLAVGAGVSLSGVPVGSIEDMRFSDDPAVTYIKVTVSIAGNVAGRIREGSVATVRTLGLLGDRYIELTPGSADRPPIDLGAQIPSIDPVDYEAVLGQSGDVVTNVVEVTASLKVVLQAIERGEGLLGAMVRNRELGEATLVDFQRTMANLQETSRSLDDILHRVNRGEGLLGRLTRSSKQDDELLASVGRSAKSLERLTARLDRGQGTLGKLLEDDAYARRVLGNLDRTLADLSAVAAKLDHGEGTFGKLVNDPTLYHETKSLVGGARRSWLLRLFGGGGTAAPPAAPETRP
jgi:phospholipid/cholesterol/gamma-HCH transport system substrate-binding protein